MSPRGLKFGICWATEPSGKRSSFALPEAIPKPGTTFAKTSCTQLLACAWAKTLKKAIARAGRTNSYSDGMCTPRTSSNIGVSLVIFVDSSVYSAIDKMDTKKGLFIASLITMR